VFFFGALNDLNYYAMHLLDRRVILR